MAIIPPELHLPKRNRNFSDASVLRDLTELEVVTAMRCRLILGKWLPSSSLVELDEYRLLIIWWYRFCGNSWPVSGW